MSAPPTLDRRTVEALAQQWLPEAKGRRLLLVHGRYDGEHIGGGFSVTVDGERRRVHVTDQHSVLGIVEAWHHHQQAYPDDDAVLVVATTVNDDQLGWDILAYAVKRSIRTVDRAHVVAQRFGAVDVDPRIRQETWLLDALLDAEPPEGWPRTGSVLTRDSAIRALIRARLGRAALGDGALDIGTLLDFSLDPGGTARFAALPPAEREGLATWLTGTVGTSAALLLRLAGEGRAADALPLGLVGSAVTRPGASPDAALAFGGLLGGVQGAELRAFTEAVEGALERWVSEAEAGGRHSDAARDRVLTVVRRAEALATDATLTEHLHHNRFLPATFTARLHALAAALTEGRSPAEVETALDAVADHHLARLEHHRVRAADMAVRLTRWLARPTAAPASVAEGVHAYITDWAWVDRALTTLWAGDPAGDPVLGQAYRTVCRTVRARRDELDEGFATHLARWARHASATEPGGCLLIEQVLTQVAVPVADVKAPVVVVLDGMSGAVAVDLAEHLTERAWMEVSPQPHRIAAVSAIPSVTHAGRASLLTGTATSGEQVVEKDGFATFWKRHHRAARLFHKADITGDAGHRLSDPLLEALSDERTVVGVVLNTIDSALDHGREGDRTGWRPPDVTYLPELFDAARNYGRPVVLVSDHGHVLDRGDTAPVPATGVESARWRTGEPGDGEIAVSGPRVLLGGGSVVVPWREDIRYTPRKAGYHGGAALAEMAVPVLVLIPSPEAVPDGWQEFAPDAVAPEWWRRGTEEPEQPQTVRSRRRAPAPAQPEALPLFAVDERTEPEQDNAAPTLGERVVASEVYAGQRAFVPRAPDRTVVAAVIDALVAADNRLSLSALARLAGRAARRPEFFATTLERLLNVDGYQVLSVVDGGRWVTFNVEALRTQFALERE